ncbi:translation protein SH3-like domain-containing protein [Hypoxylon sp. NC1633]|nr:translation protein SH3-like domain-containing protein [Hypoxylon sp. NC1633]
MNTQSMRRPLSSWKAVLRRTRQLRHTQISPLYRTMATETTPTPPSRPPQAPPPAALPAQKPRFHVLKSNDPSKPIRNAFIVYPRVPSARKANPSALERYHAQQMRRLDYSGARTALFSRRNTDAAKPGDVLQVTTSRRGGGGGGEQTFAGVCLSIRRAGVDTAILLRNHVAKVAVEMWYKVYSPNVLGIEIVWRRPKRARRARLTYMRQPKHDMGNVDHLVEEWRRTRNVFTSRGKAKDAGAAAKGTKR